jgi:hypothetical protein
MQQRLFGELLAVERLTVKSFVRSLAGQGAFCMACLRCGRSRCRLGFASPHPIPPAGGGGLQTAASTLPLLVSTYNLLTCYGGWGASPVSTSCTRTR